MDEKLRLGKMLVESNLLTEEQLKMAMDFQKSVGGKLGAIIVKLGFIEDQTLTIEKHHVVPIRFHDGVLTIAMSDPFDYEAIEELQLAVDYRIEMQLAGRSQILKAIHEIFNREEAVPSVREKSKDQLLKDLEGGRAGVSEGRFTPAQLLEALVPLLVQKGIITEEELLRKARELEAVRER